MLLSAQWIKEVNWDNSVVIVDVSTEAVRNSPAFDDAQAVNETYQRNLYNYYGREVDRD